MKKRERFYKDLSIYYDLVYIDKDYEREAEFVKSMVKKHRVGRSLLDVGCGTGRHDTLLKKDFRITGVDPNKQILEIAKCKNRGIKYLPLRMQDFKLPDKFDIIISLFGVLHYAIDYPDLRRTFKNFYKHLKPKGLLIFDVGLTTDNFKDHTEIIGSRKGRLGVTMIENVYRTDKYHANVSLVFLIRTKSDFRTEFDEHIQLIIDVPRTKSMLESIGFKVLLYDRDFSGKRFTKTSKAPVFVCIKK